MRESTYTTAEAAREIGIKVRTVREWIRIGHLHAYKDPGDPWWRIPESEIRRLAGTNRHSNRRKDVAT